MTPGRLVHIRGHRGQLRRGLVTWDVVGRSGDRRLRVPTPRRFGPGLLSYLDRDLLLGLLLLGLYLLAGGIEYRALEALR